jgi:hypothetical protein
MTTLTKPQQAMLDRVRAEGRIVENGRAKRTIEALEKAGLVSADWDAGGNGLQGFQGGQRITVTALCGSIGCKRPVAEEITYTYRNGGERETDLVCTPCADGYERRVVLTSFTRRPLFTGTLQIHRRSWTTGVNPKSYWEDLRPAYPSELALIRTIPEGGAAFWLRPDGTSYYAAGARTNADQLVRIIRSGKAGA